MAKQDLYKTAQQSAKLFKLIQDEQLLESWVKNKIISAAEDISTVYQYLNYEKQFKDYSKMIAESTDLSESKRAVLTSKLAEAKEKVKELKKKAAKDKSEKMDEDKEMKVGDTKKTRTGELTKTSTGVVHKNTSYHDDGDEIASNAKSGKGVKSHAKAQTAAEKKEKAPAQKFSPKSAKTSGMKDGVPFDNRDKVDEAKDEKCNHSAKGKKCPVHGLKECGMYEAAKWRDAKHKDKLYTQEPYGDDDDRYGDDDYYNPKPDDYPGAKNLKGGGEFDHNDPLRKGYGRHGTGSVNTHGKRKGMPSRDHVRSLKGSIKDAHGTHTEPSLPEAKQKASDKVKEAIARAKDVLEGKGKKGDGNLANNAKPYDKVTRGDVISGRLGKDEKGGKKAVVKESTELDRMKTIMQRLNG